MTVDDVAFVLGLICLAVFIYICLVEWQPAPRRLDPREIDENLAPLSSAVDPVSRVREGQAS